ncbi:hypothetical protein R1sor_005324 [Riccia sorocarpa]|uniref:Uncharacterized protein n=1 Tax=Riccia sorocarpa TaxID=122646 RepID=A0ABD3HJP4_9MARC
MEHTTHRTEYNLMKNGRKRNTKNRVQTSNTLFSNTTEPFLVRSYPNEEMKKRGEYRKRGRGRMNEREREWNPIPRAALATTTTKAVVAEAAAKLLPPLRFCSYSLLINTTNKTKQPHATAQQHPPCQAKPNPAQQQELSSVLFPFSPLVLLFLLSLSPFPHTHQALGRLGPGTDKARLEVPSVPRRGTSCPSVGP